MKMRQYKYYIGTILFCFCFLCFPIDKPCCGAIHSNDSISNSELDINQVFLNYKIGPFGEYYCSFDLEVLGNNFTAEGILSGQFKIFGFPIENFTLRVANILMDLNQNETNDYSTISFSSENFTIPEGTRFNISGFYSGKFLTYNANVYSFELGVDWGCMVGSQSVVIRFKDDFKLLTQGLRSYSSIETNLGFFELTWIETNVPSFITQLFLRKTSNDYLDIYEPWNATQGETYDVIIQNVELFPIEGNIFFPEWILANVSYFQLEPSQKVCIHFEINSKAKSEMSGYIEIIISLESTIGIPESFKKILIPVTIIQNESIELIVPLVGSISIITLICLLGVVIYRKDSLASLTTKYKRFSGNFQKSDTHSSYNNESAVNFNSGEKEFHWQSIQTKWETILSENELKVVKILYSEGIMNQKSLAEELDITTMSISRIISRLETKRLVTRKPMGISKMIKLKKDHL